jgi:hypothetical protein
MSDNPDHYEIFNRAITDLRVSAAPAIVDAYDFSQFKTIADIAGGHGYLLAGAKAILEREDVTDRVEIVAGAFFDSVPRGADAYLTKHIIHDWNDELSLNILKNIAVAMTAHAKLLIVEMVVPEGNEPHFSKVMDLGMLVLPGGVERTREEYHT